MIKKIARKAFPPGTGRGMKLKKTAALVGLARPVPYDEHYDRWMQWVEKDTFLPLVEYEGKETLFSIVIPFYNTKDKYLSPLIDSIRGQSFENWELIMADASTDDERSKAIEAISKTDQRLKYHKMTENGGISFNTNFALTKATGKYIVFCDHDDTLNPHALNEMAAKIVADPAVDILYSDEDKLSDDGKWRHSPFFKPDWSPHVFLNTNYTNHLSVVRRELVESVDGLRPELDGSQDYDLLLRIHRKHKGLKVAHVNKILYHWREAEGSTAVNHNSKSYAFEAGRKALQEYDDKGTVKGIVTNIPERPGFYNHKFSPEIIKSAHVVISINEQDELNQAFLLKLKEKTNAGLVTPDFLAVQPSKLDEKLKSLVAHDALFIFRQTALPQESDWLDRLCGVLELPDVKAVAPRIMNSDYGAIIDMGIVRDAASNPVELFKGRAANDQTPLGHVEWVRDVDELSGAVEGRVLSKKVKKDSQTYNVVWSYVNFRKLPIAGDARFFSSNLFITKKGKIKTSGKE
ncbi:MAG TPA: glycosyltransferase [Candidatus Saccharibacteria bacterium]|nr:glycosyltransferase [Candidatus Saccharibacteria bacterium]